MSLLKCNTTQSLILAASHPTLHYPTTSQHYIHTHKNPGKTGA